MRTRMRSAGLFAGAVLTFGIVYPTFGQVAGIPDDDVGDTPDRLTQASELRADPALREFLARLGALEQVVGTVPGDAGNLAEDRSVAVGADAFVKLVRSGGPVMLTAIGASRIEMGDEETEGAGAFFFFDVVEEENVLDRLRFRIDPSSGAYIPSWSDSGVDRVRFWGSADGFPVLRDAMGRLGTGGSGEGFARGITELSNSTLPQGERLESLLAVEVGDRAVLLFADSAGLVGVRYARDGGWSRLDEQEASSLDHLGEVLRFAAAGFFEGDGPGDLLAATARCCISCGGAHCCCSGQACDAGAAQATCNDGDNWIRCSCTSNGCECVPVSVGD